MAINLPVDAEDKDVFRFGDIGTAHKVFGDAAKTAPLTTLSIEQKLYDKYNAITPLPESSLTGAFGDLVWYHTRHYKDQYRYPTLEELKTLFTTASVIPGYCYSDHGFKIYGAYFYDTPVGQARVEAFPTGSKEVERFKNVSDLVRANKGLFLPITGFLGLRALRYNYRRVLNPNAVGKYMSAECKNSGSFDYEFGTISYTQINPPVAQSRAIRGVWVGKNPISAAQNPSHPDFKNLR